MTKTLKVILVDIMDPKISTKLATARMNELESLVNTYGGVVVIKKIQKKQMPNYQTYVGSGKLEEIKLEAIEAKVDLIIVNNLLKSQQLYNIKKILDTENIQVWDRVDLILKIFAKHAETAESKLQIELAALRHMGPRIFGMGMELSRQGGGIGTSGIGETNTEIMKRHLATQEQKIKEKLQQVQKQQAQKRNQRIRQNLATVAIVGYTNAGKSQLLQTLTQKNIKVKDELFATLDTRIGQLFLPSLQKVCLLSDTIGFIQDMPPNLIDAFKSTLDEAIHADILLHVVDYADTNKYQKIQVVQNILEDLGVADKPTLLVANKIDLITNLKTTTFANKFKKYQPTFVSAINKNGFNELLDKIAQTLT